jgi:acetyltransferase
VDAERVSRPETSFTLTNGQSVTVRLVRPGDASLLVAMFRHLSESTRRLRFHAYTGSLPEERIWREAVALSDPDPTCHVALVAVLSDDAGEHIVGTSQLARATSDAVEAEAAVVVRDDYQKMGLGTHLLEQLLPIARSMGIQRIFGWIMTENKHMLQILRKTKLPIHTETHAGEMFAVISINP